MDYIFNKNKITIKPIINRNFTLHPISRYAIEIPYSTYLRIMLNKPSAVNGLVR